MAKGMNIEVHQAPEGMIISMNKHALTAIKNGHVGDLNLVSGGNTLKVQLMRDTTFRRIKKDQEKKAQQQDGDNEGAEQISKT